jgi:hypothetical protein
MISEWTRHTLVIEQLEKAHAQAALDAAVARSDHTPRGSLLTFLGLAQTVMRLARRVTPAAVDWPGLTRERPATDQRSDQSR